MRAPLLALSLASALFLIGPVAHAGNGSDRGGGDVFLCKKEGLAGLMGKRRVRFVDTYDAKERTTHPTLSKLGTDEAEAERKILEGIAKVLPGEAEKLRGILGQMKLVADENLEELDDDIREIPKGCQKKQLGVQDLSEAQESVVRYSPTLHALLTPAERVMFKLHEAWVKLEYLKTRKPVQDTEGVRTQVSTFIANASFRRMIHRVSGGIFAIDFAFAVNDRVTYRSSVVTLRGAGEEPVLVLELGADYRAEDGARRRTSISLDGSKDYKVSGIKAPVPAAEVNCLVWALIYGMCPEAASHQNSVSAMLALSIREAKEEVYLRERAKIVLLKAARACAKQIQLDCTSQP